MRLLFFKGFSFVLSYMFAVAMIVFMSGIFFSKITHVISSDLSSEESFSQIQESSQGLGFSKSSPIFFLQSTFAYFQGKTKASNEFWSSIFLSMKLAAFAAMLSFLLCWSLLQIQHLWPESGGLIVWFLSLFLSSIPALFLGPFLIYVFCFRMDMFSVVFDDSKVMTWILPAIVMSSRPCGLFLRFWMVRVQKLRRSTWIQYFQSMGLSKERIEKKFLSREILIPLLALMPQLLMNLFSGSLLVEWLFSVPGIGREMKFALETRNHSQFVALLLIVFSVSFSLRYFFRNLSLRLDPRSKEVGHL